MNYIDFCDLGLNVSRNLSRVQTFQHYALDELPERFGICYLRTNVARHSSGMFVVDMMMEGNSELLSQEQCGIFSDDVSKLPIPIAFHREQL